MKLLMTSPAFLPRIGGIELATAQHAEGLAVRGHQVIVATRTPGAEPAGARYRIVRCPSPRELMRLTRWCDVFYQANVSLRLLWPLVLVRRPWVVSHHSWYRQADGRRAVRDHLKIFLLRYAAASIAVSRAIAADLPGGAIVIENGYRDTLFRRLPDAPRTRELVFVGRLVSDKGVDLLLEALGRLRAGGVRPRLSIVGDGPERPALQSQTRDLGLVGQVEFVGVRTGEDLVGVLNDHEILVVPSRYDEPFGVVALEGIACGSAVLGSAGGGLVDAIGPCGLTFPNGDLAALTERLATLLTDAALRERFRAAAPSHLRGHAADAVVDRYARVLEAAVP